MPKPALLSFDEDASVFADYGMSVRGMVRYKLTQKNLKPFLDQKNPLRILDVGGGSGPDAAWLADAGHSVVMLEPSEQQREYATRRFNFFLSDTARERIELLPVDLSEFAGDPAFDAVIIHGVAMYQSRPEQFVKAATDRVKPGGLISLIEKGYYGAEARAIRADDYVGLERLRKTRRAVNHLGREVWAFKPEELERILVHGVNAEILEWSGIRLIADDINAQTTALEENEIKEILKLECEHGHNPTIQGQGQMLHFIARKKA